MKKLLLPLALSAGILLPATATAEPLGIYVAPRLIGGTVNFKEGKDLETFGGALAVGYDFHPALKVPVRVELEYTKLGDVSKTYRKEDWKGKATVGVSSLFVNAYLDWHNSSAFTPYVNLGLGTGFLSAKYKSVDLDDGDTDVWGKKTTANTAWNIGLGSALKLSDNFSLDLGYRYAYLGNKIRTKGDEDGDYMYTKNLYTHTLLLGARFSF